MIQGLILTTRSSIVFFSLFRMQNIVMLPSNLQSSHIRSPFPSTGPLLPEQRVQESSRNTLHKHPAQRIPRGGATDVVHGPPLDTHMGGAKE